MTIESTNRPAGLHRAHALAHEELAGRSVAPGPFRLPAHPQPAHHQVTKKRRLTFLSVSVLITAGRHPP